MTGIEVQAPGMQTTVQDLGRPGFGHLGVSACGAADPLALRIGNLLLGNPDHAAALEMTLQGGRFLFHGAAWFALAGADFGATLDELPVPLWTPLPASAGQSLALGGAQLGARCYLCLRGGIDVPAVLGSRSTHLPSRIGGLDGRALQEGRCAAHRRCGAGFQTRGRIRPAAPANLRPAGGVLRITEAAQTARFPEASRTRLLTESWTVQTDSSRMGVRLHGVPLADPLGGSMITEGAPLGAIQVTPSGEPVILVVDHQTTGGYPKIGCVISADRWRIGQLRPRQSVRFVLVSFEDARRLLIDQEQLLRPEVSMGMKSIDLNCDLGEREDLAADVQELLLGSVTSANIACGAHAGSEALMRLTIEQALRHGVAIGAHPGYPDRANFGRLELAMPLEEMESSVEQQIRALMRIAAQAGAEVRYVKPHGALYNQAARDPVLAAAIARAVARVQPRLWLVGLAGSGTLEVWRDAGFRVAAEAFADRRYEPDGSLRSRQHGDALLDGPGAAAAQALAIALHGGAVASDGSIVSIHAETLCIHGDTPGAAAIARAVRRRLEEHGVAVRSWIGPGPPPVNLDFEEWPSLRRSPAHRRRSVSGAMHENAAAPV